MCVWRGIPRDRIIKKGRKGLCEESSRCFRCWRHTTREEKRSPGPMAASSHSWFRRRLVHRWMRLRKHGKHKKLTGRSVICSSTWRCAVRSPSISLQQTTIIFHSLRVEFWSHYSTSIKRGSLIIFNCIEASFHGIFFINKFPSARWFDQVHKRSRWIVCQSR